MAIQISDMTTSVKPKPPRILCYGPPGIGKTWFGADAPAPVFLQTEDGLGKRAGDTPHFPLCRQYSDVLEVLEALKTGEHDRRTLVIDTADWLDHLILDAIELKYDKNDKAFGKDQVVLSTWWRALLNLMDDLRDERGMAVLFLAHSQVKRYDAPETKGYDRYMPKLARNSTAVLQEWCDAIFFAHQPVAVLEEELGFKKTRTRAVGKGAVLRTKPNAAYIAKSRYALPEEIPFGPGEDNPWNTINAGIVGTLTVEGES